MELREILYDNAGGGEFYVRRARPDDEKLDAFIDKYATLMDFER